MTVASGNVAYHHGSPPCSGVGLTWTSKDLDEALHGRVSEAFFDDVGKAEVREILTPLAATEFAVDGLKSVLSLPDDIEDWRVGETIAETYLTDHRACQFPWPDSRDERKSRSSLPGADLVGLGNDESGACLAFGEVKTSSEANYPPKTVYGQTGLKKQLENLRDQKTGRDELLKYLAHRAKAAPWLNQFKVASKRYLCNKSDIQLFGFLVRDVPPHEKDLHACVQELANDCPYRTRIEFLALYLPEGRINGMGTAMLEKRVEGDV